MERVFFLEKKNILPIFYYNMIDLHSHTFFSDGKLSPTSLIDLAIKKNIQYLAITDHDTCQALDIALHYARDKEITIIPGIEIEVDFAPGEFHLLGLNLKNWHNSMDTTMTEIQQKREERNHRLIRLMQQDGIPIIYDEVRNEAEGKIVARPHFARVMIKKGIVKNIKDAFNLYLAPGKPYYSRKESLPLEQALTLISDAGGKSVLAHPLSLYVSWGKIKERLLQWRDMGLDGIEAWHSGARVVEAQRFEDMANQLGMFVTGGSDYHGKNTLNRELGLGPGRIPIKDELIENII